jgi:hypothetical protein
MFERLNRALKVYFYVIDVHSAYLSGNTILSLKTFNTRELLFRAGELRHFG